METIPNNELVTKAYLEEALERQYDKLYNNIVRDIFDAVEFLMNTLYKQLEVIETRMDKLELKTDNLKNDLKKIEKEITRIGKVLKENNDQLTLVQVDLKVVLNYKFMLYEHERRMRQLEKRENKLN